MPTLAIFANFKYWIALGIVAAIAYVGWDYANAKSKLAARDAEVIRLKTSLKAIDTTNKLNLAAMRQLDKSCSDQINRLLNLRDIDKIIKESATPMDDALNFDPNAVKK